MINSSDLEAFGYYDMVELNQEYRSLNPTPLDMVKEFSTKTKQEPSPELYEGLIVEEYVEFLKSTTEGNPENSLKELADLVYVCYGYALSQGWDLDEAIKRVHQNNLGRITQPDGSIKRREDGKILKNPDYPKVNLKNLVKGYPK